MNAQILFSSLVILYLPNLPGIPTFRAIAEFKPSAFDLILPERSGAPLNTGQKPQ